MSSENPDRSDSRRSTEPDLSAARIALNRAKEAAAARGFRPGMKPRRSAIEQAKSMAEVDAKHAKRGPDAREPQLFSSSVARLLAERGWTDPVSIGGVIGRWDQIVGSNVAEHCQPESFEDGVVVVRADSTAWATQVRLLVPQLRIRIDQELGEGVVTEVKVLGPAGPSWVKGLRRVDGPGPRDTYG